MTARTFYVEIYCETDLTQEALEAQLDSVMEALQSEPGEADIDLGAHLVSLDMLNFTLMA